jgi:serine/threonine-protein kinase
MNERALYACVAVTALAVVTSFCGVARAASPEEQAAAQALFDDAKELVKSGRAAEACPKFEESQRLDPGLGTQLNLADCYERVGRTASAWTIYVEVAPAARREGQDARAEHAEARAAALKPLLAKLTIVVPLERRVTGMSVTRDTSLVREAQWSVAIPVDPGQHTIFVEAPGKERWQTSLDVPAQSSSTVTVPVLKDAPPGATSGAAPGVAERPRDPHAGKAQRIGGVALAGAGVVGVGLGTFFGLRAMSKKDDASCDGNNCPDSDSRELYEDAQSAGNVSTIGFIVGGLALAGGAVLYFTAPKPSREKGVEAGALLSPGLVGVRAGGRF